MKALKQETRKINMYWFRWLMWLPLSIGCLFVTLFLVGSIITFVWGEMIGLIFGFTAGAFLFMFIGLKIVPDRKKTVGLINLLLLGGYVIFEIIQKMRGFDLVPLIMSECGFLSGFIALCVFYN